MPFQLDSIVAGRADQSIWLFMQEHVDGSNTDGRPMLGLVASDLTAKYCRLGESSTAITVSDLAALNSAHSDGGWKEFYGGVYRFDLPDAVVAAGAERVAVAVTAGTKNGQGGAMIGLGFPVDVQMWKGDGVQAVSVTGVPVVDVGRLAGVTLSNGAFLPSYWHASTGLKPLLTGTASAGSPNTITIATHAVAQFYRFKPIKLTGGTGANQDGWIISYDNASGVATILGNWLTDPDNTTTYAVLDGLPWYTGGSVIF